MASCSSGGNGDRVVGDATTCDYQPARTIPAQHLANSECIGVGRINVQRTLTIRTSKGTTYEVEVPANVTVKIGDDWPGDHPTPAPKATP